MFEQSILHVLSAASAAPIAAIAALSAIVVLLGVLVALMRRRVRIKLGPLVIEPSIRDGETTGPFPSLGLSMDETEPFDLAEINEAMKASETLRAIEALRAVEAKAAQENLSKVGTRGRQAVRSFPMAVCPLCILYEVTGNSPKCHVVPSDMRVVEVGRSMDGQVRSTQPNVSQRHFRLVITPRGTAGRWAGYDVALEDCGSRNGTWVNGVRVGEGSVGLADGDIIEAASARYLFYFVLRGDG